MIHGIVLSKGGSLMIRIGLTGGIGTGKSTISLMLKEANFKIIDADVIAKEVLIKYFFLFLYQWKYLLKVLLVYIFHQIH